MNGRTTSISLHSVGIPQEGSICDKKWMASIKVPKTQSIINSKFLIDTPCTKLLFIQNVTHGSFGSIDLAKRIDSSGTCNVFVKSPLRGGQSLLNEACVQKLVGECLESEGFIYGTPKVYDIFKTNDNSICFTMEVLTNSHTLHEMIASLMSNDFNYAIRSCLIQLCTMLTFLHRKIGLNHRDLKPSNILVIHTSPIRKKFTIDDISVNIQCHFLISLIDFGFSCIGSPDTSKSDLSLGFAYDICDPCPKEGRDMYLFLCFLYAQYHTKLAPELHECFERWLDNGNPGSNKTTRFLKKHINDYEKWIYFIAGNATIPKFYCTPYIILRDLSHFF